MSTSSIDRQRPHTGFFSGHLRCVAIRHGWTRSFSISPDEIDNLDYDALARILELATLKLRSTNLRIFVEMPPGSGTFSKVRFWKDDGSLQSVLVKNFFRTRLEEDALCNFEIRDGKERKGPTWDGDESVASEAHYGSFAMHKKRSTFALNWLAGRRAPSSRRPSNGGQATDTEGEAESTQAQPKTRLARFFSYLFVSKPKRKHAYNQVHADDHDEATPLQATVLHQDRVEPVNERSALLTASKRSSLRQRLMYATHHGGGFFTSGGPRSSVTKLTKSRSVKFQNDVSVTTFAADMSRQPSTQSTPVEQSAWEHESFTADEDASDRATPPGLITAFWRSFWTPVPVQPQPKVKQVKTTNKLKRVAKPAIRNNVRPTAEGHFKGARVVRRPEDAFPPRADSAISGLFDGDSALDPFRG